MLAGKPVSDARHRIQGGGYSAADLEMIRYNDLDGYLQVTDEEAIAASPTAGTRGRHFCWILFGRECRGGAQTATW